MCGRQCVGAASIAETSRYSGKTIPGGCQENKNFCPSLESALVVKKEADSGEKELVSAKWGLMPAWMMKDLKPGAKANHGKLNNARAETVASTSSFRNLLGPRRAVVIMDGFYEWKSTPDAPYAPTPNNVTLNAPVDNEKPVKQPYFVSFDTPMKCAALYDTVRDTRDGSFLTSYTVLTCTPHSRFLKIHDRQPVFLTNSTADEWLNAPAHKARTQSFIDHYIILGQELLQKEGRWHPCTKKVNSIYYKGDDCAEEVDVQAIRKEEERKSGVQRISSFFNHSSSQNQSPEAVKVKVKAEAERQDKAVGLSPAAAAPAPATGLASSINSKVKVGSSRIFASFGMTTSTSTSSAGTKKTKKAIEEEANEKDGMKRNFFAPATIGSSGSSAAGASSSSAIDSPLKKQKKLKKVEMETPQVVDLTDD